MKRRKNRRARSEVAVPAHLPPLAGPDPHDEYAPGRRPRTWLWTLFAGLVAVALVAYVVVLGVAAVAGGLRDRAQLNRQVAQEHVALGTAHMEAGEYELAAAEFRLAVRYDSGLSDARSKLREAEAKALAQVAPTSETRRDAATALYKQAVTAFDDGKLAEAVAGLDELRGLDPQFEQQNVQNMLIGAHYELALQAVGQDQVAEAERQFQAVLALKPDHGEAQNQLNLLHLYAAAMTNWGKDWPATIQAFKGLYSLAPGYKDVRIRLHDAHAGAAEQQAATGDWCAASEEYAAAVSVLVLEETVDRRDDAALKCQATAEAPRPTATPRPRPTATAAGSASTAVPAETATAEPPAGGAGQGRIAFTSFSAVQQRYDIYVVDLAGGGAARLLQENASQPAFGPGGKRLAFRNLHPSHRGLGLIGTGGGESTDLTTHEEDSAPAWSPDGDQIVFASDKHGDRKWRIYVISPGAVRGEGEEWVFGRMPAWSPDGALVTYQGCDERGDNCGIWAMKAGGFEPRRVTKDPSDTAPAWSPDGRRIAFISARSGNWELYVVDSDGAQEKRLTDSRAAEVAPAWSPDGKRLAFLSNREGAWAVYVLDVASGRVTKVIATGDPYADPTSERLSWTK